MRRDSRSGDNLRCLIFASKCQSFSLLIFFVPGAEPVIDPDQSGGGTGGAPSAPSTEDIYLRAHADIYGIDPDHVAVWGQPAGGYLAAMAGVTGNVTAFDQSGDRESSSVQAVVDEFGPADLGNTAADFDATTQVAYCAARQPGRQPLCWDHPAR